eukprot:1121896-Pleurochrysis_carterae.AAC.1
MWCATGSWACWGADTVRHTVRSVRTRALTAELVHRAKFSHANGNGCEFMGVSQVCAGCERKMPHRSAKRPVLQRCESVPSSTA